MTTSDDVASFMSDSTARTALDALNNAAFVVRRRCEADGLRVDRIEIERQISEFDGHEFYGIHVTASRPESLPPNPPDHQPTPPGSAGGGTEMSEEGVGVITAMKERT